MRGDWVLPRALAAAGGAMVGLAAESRLASRLRDAPDPEAGEPFGRLQGKPIHVISADGTGILGDEMGEGEAVVFSHGLGLSRHAWHYPRAYLEGFRRIFYDQRGHGDSGDGPRSLGALGEDLLAMAEAAGGMVHLVGHSMGGIAILAAARVEPGFFRERVGAVVLVSTAAQSPLTTVPPALRRALLSACAAAVRSGGVRRLRGGGTDLGFFLTRLLGFGKDPSPSQVAFVCRLLAEVAPEVEAEFLRALADFDLREVLRRISNPLLVAVGTEDRLTPPRHSEEMVALAGRGRLLRLYGAGHMAPMERHVIFNAELSAFLRRG